LVTFWKGGRAAECGGLENRVYIQHNKVLSFPSYSPRQKLKEL